MRKRIGAALLGLCIAGGGVMAYKCGQPEKMTVPVTRVFAVVPAETATQSPLQTFKAQRAQERERDIAALREAAAVGDQAAGEYMQLLMKRRENELAVESALSAMGHRDAVCAIREGAAVVCLRERMDEENAKTVIELCEKLTGECAENVFLLDECGYSW